MKYEIYKQNNRLRNNVKSNIFNSRISRDAMEYIQKTYETRRLAVRIAEMMNQLTSIESRIESAKTDKDYLNRVYIHCIKTL